MNISCKNVEITNAELVNLFGLMSNFLFLILPYNKKATVCSEILISLHSCHS